MRRSRGAIRSPSCRRSRCGVTEHRLHGVCCPECAARTRAELPAACPRSAFGPRLQAAVVTLAVRNRVSRRDTTELARELFGVELATGSVDAIVQRAGRGARRAAHPARAADQGSVGRQHRRDRLEDRRRPPDALGRSDQPDRGVPDRGRPPRLRGENAARRALRRDRLLGPLARLRLPRPQPAAALLGPPAQRLHRPQRRHGRTEAVRQRRPPDRTRPLRRLGQLPARRRPGPPPSPDRAAPGQAPQAARARRPQEPADQVPPRVREEPPQPLARALDLHPHHGVEPTNNHAERGLRGAVIYRKLSLGSQSDQGERTIERLLSASSPADSANARSSPTSPTSSPPTSAATQSPHSPDLSGAPERLRTNVRFRGPIRPRPRRAWPGTVPTGGRGRGRRIPPRERAGAVSARS